MSLRRLTSVAGIGQENDLGLVRYAGQKVVDVGGEIGGLDLDGGRADADADDGKLQKTVFRKQDFVARAGVDTRDAVEQLLRTVAADDAAGIEVTKLADGFTQFRA